MADETEIEKSSQETIKNDNEASKNNLEASENNLDFSSSMKNLFNKKEKSQEEIDKNNLAASTLNQKNAEEKADEITLSKQIKEREKALKEKVAGQGGIEEIGVDDKEAASITKMKEKRDDKAKAKTIEVLKNISGGIKNMASSLTGALSVTAKGIGIGIAFFALSAFLKSDMFRTILDMLVDFVFDLGQLFTGQISFYEAFKNNMTLFTAAFAFIITKFLVPAVVGFLKFKTLMIGTLIPGISAFFSSMVAAMSALLAPLAPLLIPIAAIAAGFFVLTKMITSFRDNFDKANEEFGFFGAIGVSLLDTIRDMFVSLLEFLDIFGLIPDDFIEYMKNIDIFQGLRDVIEWVGNFFGGLSDMISNAIGSLVPDWVKKWIPGTDASKKRKGDVEAVKKQQLALESGVSGVHDVKGVNLDKLAKEQAELEKKRVATTVVNNVTTSQNNVAGDTIKQDRSTLYVHSGNNAFTNTA